MVRSGCTSYSEKASSTYLCINQYGYYWVDKMKVNLMEQLTLQYTLVKNPSEYSAVLNMVIGAT